MPVERYCTMKDCPGGEGCINEYRTPGDACTMEYVASAYSPAMRWKGDGPPPSRWMVGNTLVYRSFSDYCD